LSLISTPSALSAREQSDVPLPSIPSTMTIDRRCRAAGTDVIALVGTSLIKRAGAAIPSSMPIARYRAPECAPLGATPTF
jgi:hypothetical protein